MLFRNKNTGATYQLLFYDKYKNKVTLIPFVWIREVHMTVEEFLNDYEFSSVQS